MTTVRAHAAKLSAERRTCPSCKRGGALREHRGELRRVVRRACRYCGYEDIRHYSGPRYVVNRGSVTP